METENLWNAARLAQYLSCTKNGLYNLIGSGRITAADGLIRVFNGRARFDPEIVKRRVRAGLFGRGLDENGKLVAGTRPKLKLHAV